MSWFFSKSAQLDPETIAWFTAIGLNGGSCATATRTIADNLIKAIKATSYNAKIVWLLPLLGDDIPAILVPLRDTLGKGAATNVNGAFQNADYSISTGLKGNGSTKAVNTAIKPSELGSSNNGGFGYWENDYDDTGSSNVYPMGCTGSSQYFAVVIHSTFAGRILWGGLGNGSSSSGSNTNGHYYGQRSSATLRECFFNGSSIGTNTTSDTASEANDANIWLCGINANPSSLNWKGRCACAYMTDGTLSGADVADFDTLLRTYLFTPTSRPTS